MINELEKGGEEKRRKQWRVINIQNLQLSLIMVDFVYVSLIY